MDIDNLNEDDKKELVERLDYYIDTAQNGLSKQSDGFSSIDTKADILLASLGILVSIGISAIASNLRDIFEIENEYAKWGLLLLIIAYSFTVIINFVYSFQSVRNRTFNYGRDVSRIRDLDSLGVSNLKIKKDIADGLEEAFHSNAYELSEKVRSYVISQRLWILNVGLSVIIIFLTSVI